MESVYKVIELVGSSEKSWEDAALAAVETARRHQKDIRVAEVTTHDQKLDDNHVVAYRAKAPPSPASIPRPAPGAHRVAENGVPSRGRPNPRRRQGVGVHETRGNIEICRSGFGGPRDAAAARRRPPQQERSFRRSCQSL